MMSEVVKKGDCLRMTAFEYVAENGNRFRYKMPKDTVVLAVVVGTEKKVPTEEADLVDIKAALQKVIDGDHEVISAELTGITGRARI